MRPFHAELVSNTASPRRNPKSKIEIRAWSLGTYSPLTHTTSDWLPIARSVLMSVIPPARRDMAYVHGPMPPLSLAAQPGSPSCWWSSLSGATIFCPFGADGGTQPTEARGDRPPDTEEADGGLRLLRDGRRSRLRPRGRPGLRTRLRR